MHLGPLNIHFGWRQKEISGLRAFYWNILFRSLAMGLIGIFAPVFVFLTMKGVGGSWIAGVRWVMVFVLVQRVIVWLGAIKAGQIIEKIGYRWGILWGIVFQICMLLFLLLAEGDYRWLLVTATMSGMVVLFYWISRLALFSDDGVDEKFGEEMGMVTMLERGTSILAPFLGGVIIAGAGFKVLFVLGVVLLLISIVPLFFMPYHEHKDGISWRHFLRFLKRENNKKLILGFFGRGMEDLVSNWVWPLFAFIIIGTFEGLGAVTSIVMVVSVLMAFIVGRLFDRNRAKGGLEDEKIYWVGSVITAITRFTRSFAGSMLGVVGWDSLTKMVAPFYWIPFSSYRAVAAGKVSPVEFLSYRAMIYSLGSAMMALLAITMIGWPAGWNWIFGVGALGILLGLGMSQESNK